MVGNLVDRVIGYWIIVCWVIGKTSLLIRRRFESSRRADTAAGRVWAGVQTNSWVAPVLHNTLSPHFPYLKHLLF